MISRRFPALLLALVAIFAVCDRTERRTLGSTVINGGGPTTTIIQGTPVLATTVTIGTFTARVRATPQTNTITATGKSGAFWTPYVGDFVYDTTAGARFWIEKDLGTATAQITEPVQSQSGSLPYGNRFYSYVTIANGDALSVYSLPATTCSQPPLTNANNILTYLNVRCTDTLLQLGGAILLESRVDGNFYNPGATVVPLMIDSLFDGSISSAGIFLSGAITASFPALAGAGSTLDGDILLDPGTSVHIVPGTILGRAYFGPGSNPDTDAYYGYGIGISPTFFADAEMWGPAAITLQDHATLTCESGCTSSLLLTGGLKLGAAGSTTGYPWVAASHAWGAAVTITGAAIDSAGSICNPATGDCFLTH